MSSTTSAKNTTQHTQTSGDSHLRFVPMHRRVNSSTTIAPKRG
eukprot:CAMPEP_0114688852 /NCGR_PEP_ID=MMETSP0191-20121206/63913_1 /TAXON_ID=126664 /ORGANISM="Sorites sp." /LENGTH=42 /DNA_ID= /DNA_START= /DNA_END= /DNA_ORIENTATION=